MDDRILKATCLIGKIMLESGAEIYRIEQTMQYFCVSYGIAEYECSVTPTEIITSIIDEKGTPHTYMRRVTKRQLNLQKVKLINDFSRSVAIKHIPIDEVEARLKKIENESHFSLPVIALASGVGTGSFAMVFGGDFQDSICGFIIGFALRIIMYYLEKLEFPDMFSNFLGGAVAALLAWSCCFVGIGNSWEIITIAVLTLLFPGLIFTNALRDLTSGDLVSGISHTVEAFSIAAALAAGAAVVFISLSPIGGIIL